MPFIGNAPARVPLTSADITDGIITNADIASGAAIAQSKIAGSFGKVLQVVTATDSTERSTSSTSFVTGSNTLSVSITPSSTSSKIFVIVCATAAAENTTQSYYTIYRDSTNLGNTNGLFQSYGTGGTAQTNCALSYLDSPSSTSALTYQVYFRKASGGYNIFLNYGSTLSSITAFEIAG